jgi:hypothetical protein
VTLARIAAVGCVATAVLTGCGATKPQTTARLPAYDVPIPIGAGPEYRLPAVSPAVARREPIAGLRCASSRGGSYGAHVELYARRLVVPMPAGIGVAPPQRRSGAYVLGGACTYAVRTVEPTGVVVIDDGPAPSLAALFEVWGQPLSAQEMAGFRGPVSAFVGGRHWNGDVGAIRLSRHAEIVLEVGGGVPAHPSYTFPPGL